MATAAFPKFAFGAGVVPISGESDPTSTATGAAGGSMTPQPTAGQPKTIEDIRVLTKVPATVVQSLLVYLKAEDTTEPAHLAFIPDSDLDAAVLNAKIEGESLSALQKGQMNYFIKFLREVMNHAGAPPPGAAASGTSLAAPPPEAEKRKISDVLDQVDDGPYQPLPAEKVAALRQFHRDVTGGDPPDNERPTAEQLSALVHRIGSGKAPYADFAVFGPYGRRQAKIMRFTAQVFVAGELVTHQLKGPSSYASWRASWNVFRAAMIMANGASPATLDRYSRGIEELTTLFPHAWGIIALADETMRAERWDITMENSKGEATWEDIIARTAYGSDGPFAHWWYMHVVGPLTTGARQATSTIAAIEGTVPAMHVLGPPAGAAFSGGSSSGKAKRRGGRGSPSESGMCVRFNAGNCNTPNCPMNHACSGCGGRFPLVRCWACNPSLKAKGKGKGSSTGGGGSASHDKKKKRKGSKGSPGAASSK